MMLRAARRALHATRRQLSTSTDALPKVPKPPTAALAKRSQLLRDVRDQRPFLMKSCRVGVEGVVARIAPHRSTHAVHEISRRARGSRPAVGEGDAGGLREERTGTRAA